MATCKTDSNTEMQHLSNEYTIKTEQILEDGTKGATTYEFTDGWQINRTLGDCMLQMFDNQLWTDVTFRCEDQTDENPDDRVHAHKILLAARSPVFQTMFFGKLKDSSEEINIKGAEGGQFKTFLRLLYTDNADLVNEFSELVDSLEMSHKYQCQFLIDVCCRKLAEKISVENSCGLLDRALLYDNQYLISHVSDFIDKNAENILMTDGYVQMSLRCLTYILKGDTFHANEAEIFNKTIEWAKRRCGSTDGRELRKTLGDAFYFLRTPNMTISEFSVCTKRKGFYSIEEHEDLMDIVDRLETSKVKIDCNFNRKRYATELVATRPNDFSYKEMLPKKIVSESISLFVEDDVYLSKVMVTNFTSANYLNALRYRTNDANYSTYDRPAKLQNAHLAVSLKVDDVLIPGKYTQISGDTPSTITLNTPYRLCSGSTYTLQAEIQFDEVKELRLQARLCDYSEPFTCLRNDILSAETIKDNAVLVHSLCFNCKSNRQ